MEQSPKICPKCRQANFPIAEFCRHCGEPIFETGSLSRSSIITRLIGHFVDGIFWMIDETVRWWEIGRLTVTSKRMRKQRSGLLKKQGQSDTELTGESREKLVNLSEEISRIATREEFLRRKSWAMTPEIVLLGIVCFFIIGIFWLRPRTDAIPVSAVIDRAFISGPIRKVAEYPLRNFSFVTSSAWFNGKLFVCGDGGFVSIDPVSGVESVVASLPEKFFARDLVVEGDKLLVAGLGGVYSYSDEFLPLYPLDNVPVPFINKIVSVRDGHLLGTVGSGLLKARQDFAVVVLGTSGLTVTGLAWLENDLWLLHERGLMKGDGTTFSKMDIPVMSGKQLSAIAATSNSLYIGTHQGLIAAIKSNQSWIWTPLASGTPQIVNDLLVASDTLMVAAEDGIYRRPIDQGFQKLTSDTGIKKLAFSGNIIAAVSPRRVSIYQFDSPTGETGFPTSILPQVGTFVQNPVPQVGVSPIPKVDENFSPPPASTNLTPPSKKVLGIIVPDELIGPYIKSSFWDGNRLFIGTSNSGLWALENEQWQNLSMANGKLADDQVNKIFSLNSKGLAFGWLLGLVDFQAGLAKTVLSSGKARNLLDIGGEWASPVVLFRDGRLAQIRNGNLQEIFQVPLEYQKVLRGVEVITGKYYFISDLGVLFKDDRERWKMAPLDSATQNTTKFFVKVSQQIHFVQSNGGVFTFSNNEVKKIGSVGGEPTGMTVAGNSVFVADKSTIFRIKGNSLEQIGRYTSNLPLTGFEVIPEKRSAVIFTEFGPDTISINL